MAAAKGTIPPNAGKGRPAGVPNKNTALIRDMIAQALDNAGGVEYLTSIAQSHPGPFLALVGKVMPVQITGADGGPVKTDNRWTVEIVKGNAETPAT